MPECCLSRKFKNRRWGAKSYGLKRVKCAGDFGKMWVDKQVLPGHDEEKDACELELVEDMTERHRA